MSRAVLVPILLAAVLSAQGPTAAPRGAADPALKQAAAEAATPALKALYEEFAPPHDRVLLTGRKEELRVRPLPFANKRSSRELRGTLKLVPLDPAEKPEPLANYPAGEVISHTSYEWLALERLEAFDKEQAALPAPDRLAASERVLAAVLQFHESERQEGLRKGKDWEPVRQKVRDRLFDVRLAQLEARVGAAAYPEATAQAKRLLDLYAAGDGPTADNLGRVVLKLVGEIHADPKLDDAGRLALLEQATKAILPHEARPTAARAAERLKQLAREALREAVAANDRAKAEPDKGRAEKHAARAQEYLDRSYRLWPTLEDQKPALHAVVADSTLRVGVRELPEFLSPALAVTDDERRVVDLVFEGLLEARDEGGKRTYVPALAEALPAVIAQGRRFHLVPNAQWSNGKPVLPVDVRHSLDLALAKRTDPVAALAAGFLERAVVGGDVRRLDVLFRRGLLDPLSPLTFKVVPSGADPLDAAFAKKPVGSGPYQVEGVKNGAGKKMLVLVANPQYDKRPDHAGRPAIRTVQFVATADPVGDLRAGRIDVALDVPLKQYPNDATLRELKLAASSAGLGTLDRRVYYLAVNHAKPALKAAEFRRALAQSIPRVEMLKLLGPGKPLAGLFPPGTWAASAETADLYDEDLAQSGLAKAVTAATTLTLKLPAGDAALREAFALWAERLKKLSGDKLTLAIEELPARDVRAAVERGDYELAYAWYDHADDAFSLGPLFADVPGRAENVFRYGSATVEPLVAAARDHRAFGEAAQRTRTLAAALATEMPLVPLWQREPRHLWRSSVKVVSPDPYRPLARLERWTLERAGGP